MSEALVRRASLAGWGRTATSSCSLVEPDRAEQIPRVLADAATERGAIGRGLGRSYGDAAQNGGGVVVSSDALARIIELDAEAKRLNISRQAVIKTMVNQLLQERARSRSSGKKAS